MAFTLIELLIVVAIISLLVSILLPSLSSARELTLQATCASNQRGLYQAGTLYGADYDGFMGPKYNIVQGMWSNPAFCPPMPPQLVAAGFSQAETMPVDYYAACGYIDWSRRNYHGERGSDALICPVAVNKLGMNIFRIYTHAWGSLECHFWWSALVTGYNGKCEGIHDHDWFRNNTFGPYKPEDLKNAACTFFTGDAECLSDPDSSYMPAEYCFWGRWTPNDVGLRATCFGELTIWYGELLDNAPYIHTGGPNGTYWDGHVEKVSPPPLATPKKLGPCLTADHTENYGDQFGPRS